MEQVEVPTAVTHSPLPEHRKKVSFSPLPAEEIALQLGPGDGSPARDAGKAAAGGGTAVAPLLHSNELFSPGAPQRQDSWTIEAQRSDRVMETPTTGGVLAEGYTPASSGWLESARKVDDLRARLEGLEQSLKEMESRAVQHLDRSLQEKVLATAAKIVQKRFLADKELDQKLQKHILQTAIKVVKRQGAAQAGAAGAAAPAEPADQAANPNRRLQFEQGEGSSTAASMQQYVAHIEQGLGEVLRQLEKKVDSVASLLDQNAMELLEARLAGGLVTLEARLAALEEAQQLRQPMGAPDGSRQLLARVAAMEAAMLEQSRSVTDLLKALGEAGASQHVGAAVAAAAAGARQSAAPAALPMLAAGVQSPAKAAQVAGVRSPAKAAQVAGVQSPAKAVLATGVRSPAKAVQAAGVRSPARPAAAAGVQSPAKAGRTAAERPASALALAPAGAAAAAVAAPRPRQLTVDVLAEQQSELEAEQARKVQASQLYQRRAAVARRSALRESGPSASASPRHSLPRLRAHHGAGLAQQIAIDTARQQLALQAQRAREEAEAETPVWLSMVYFFGWGLLGLLGMGAVLVGMVAALVKSGRINESDLDFLWK